MGNSIKKTTVSSEMESGAKETPISDKFGVHLAQTAWRVALPFLLFSISGIMIDKKFDTAPVFSIIGILVALLAVFTIIYKYIQDNFPETFGGSKK